MRVELIVAAIILVLAGSCATAPSISPPPTAPDERCGLVQVAGRIPVEVRAAISAARRADGPGALAAMDRARKVADELHTELVRTSDRLPITTRTRLVTAQLFAEQADQVFVGGDGAPTLPDPNVLFELERGVTQVESLLSAVATPCSS